MFTMFPIAILLVSSSTWYQTNAGRLQNLERKLHAFEMSVIQDIHLLREDIHLAEAKVEDVLTSMNKTTSNVLDTWMTEEYEHRIAERIGLKMEATVVQQLKRVKRAFVSEKMKLVAKQQEQESSLMTHAQRLENALEAMTEKIDSSIRSSSSALHELFNMNVNTIEEQMLKTNETVKETLLRVERSVNSSLLEIAKKQGEQINTMTEKLENGINKIRQIGENSRINEMLQDIFQAIHVTQLTSLMSLGLRPTHYLSDRISRYLTTCVNLRTFEDCRSVDYHAIAELTNIGKGVRLGNLSITDDGVQGRLEIFYADEWGTVCDDLFSDKSAKVACGMLGYRNGVFKGQAYFGQGSLPILFDNIACSGYENTLLACPGYKRNHDCTHGEDVGVICRN